jgi:hypothetical protein
MLVAADPTQDDLAKAEWGPIPDPLQRSRRWIASNAARIVADVSD